jgi:serine/threonine protein phosphatase 1
MHWIIGDIHGMLGPLETLLAEIDRRDPQRQLIFAGDYVNRGPDSKRVIDLLLAVPNARFLRGNHDDVFDQVLHDCSFSGTPGEDERVAAFKWFMNFGLYQTFRSYGVSEDDLVHANESPSAKILDHLASAVPSAHHDFVRGLAPHFVHEEFFVLHAKWNIDDSTSSPSIPDRIGKHPALKHLIVWGRFKGDELLVRKAWDRRGYFGHTPVITYDHHPYAVPIIGPNIVLIDTGAALPEGQRLTAYCHETDEFIQAHASGRLIEGL